MQTQPHGRHLRASIAWETELDGVKSSLMRSGSDYFTPAMNRRNWASSIRQSLPKTADEVGRSFGGRTLVERRMRGGSLQILRILAGLRLDQEEGQRPGLGVGRRRIDAKEIVGGHDRGEHFRPMPRRNDLVESHEADRDSRDRRLRVVARVVDAGRLEHRGQSLGHPGRRRASSGCGCPC